MRKTKKETKWRLYAASASLFVGITVMLMKFYAFRLTHSTAILSDALESIVNVVAAAFLLWAVKAAESPPDSRHPYGHGKIEFITAVFEGGLITFAAIMIAIEAVKTFLNGSPAPELEQGLWVMIGAGALNGLLGLALIAIGRSTSSLALIADGKHVLSDFVSTLAVLLGLGIVKWTSINWIDPLIAMLMAIFLAYTGVPLVKTAIDGLIDAADDKLLNKILASLEKNRAPGFIRVHHVRAMRNGRRIHVDGHLVIPEFWTVQKAHDQTIEYEQKIIKETFLEGEMEFHMDPCRRAYCEICDVCECPIREKAFHTRPPLTIEELISPVDITDIKKS